MIILKAIAIVLLVGLCAVWAVLDAVMILEE